VFLFAPFIERLNLSKVVQDAGLPGSKTIPALQYFLSFLSLKLIGTERFAHIGDHSFDAGLGTFAGLNVLPKCTAMSTYSYSLDAIHLHKAAKGLRQAGKPYRALRQKHRQPGLSHHPPLRRRVRAPGALGRCP
jgi:hypothetical protein